VGGPAPPAQGHRGIGEHLPGARLRYADFFAALAGAFDRGTWSFEDVDLAVLTVPTLLSKSEADAAMRVVLEDYGHYATGRKPRQGEDALLVLDEFSALASGVDGAINLAERVRDVGVQVVVAAQSVEGLGDHRQAPRLLASCAGGIVVQQCPDPERLLGLAGMVRTLEHNWELDFYGPRGFAKARMGERPRIDPEAVRQAQPGEAWVIQAGQSIHLRVLPPPTVAPEPVEPAATLPVADDTIPLPTAEEPAPVGLAAAVALAGRTIRRAGQRMNQRRERAGRLPSPARRPWLPVPPSRDEDGDEAPGIGPGRAAVAAGGDWLGRSSGRLRRVPALALPLPQPQRGAAKPEALGDRQADGLAGCWLRDAADLGDPVSQGCGQQGTQPGNVLDRQPEAPHAAVLVPHAHHQQVLLGMPSHAQASVPLVDEDLPAGGQGTQVPHDTSVGLSGATGKTCPLGRLGRSGPATQRAV
jgi:hypothetical protein